MVEKPTTEQPEAAAPAVLQPEAAAPAAMQPEAAAPAVSQPAAVASAAMQPKAAASAALQPAAMQTAAGQTAALQPNTPQPTITQAVVLAGGLGTRLQPFTLDNPKPMYPIQGRPFIDYLMEQIAGFGIKNVVLLLGYLPEKIENHLGSGKQFGLNITYRVTPVEYDTGERLTEAADVLEDEFLLMYCDNYCPIDFSALCESYARNGAAIQMSAYANRDGYTKSNLRLSSEDGRVEEYRKGDDRTGLTCVDIGYSIVNKHTLSYVTPETPNFEAAVYPKLVEQGKLFATVTEHRYYSIGSYARIELTEQFFANRPCAFLDRDGTMNVRPPQACYVTTPEDFVWLDGAREAIKMLNESGHLVVLVSNQPGIARGALTDADLDAIHAKMNHDLEQAGAHVDAIYVCKHNWDDGCFCRKPKPGMLFQAQKDFSLNLEHCVLFGDDDRDIEAGTSARCRCFKVDDTTSLLDAVSNYLCETKGK